MPFDPAPMRRLCLAATLLGVLSRPAAANPEQAGPDMGPWSFTQETVNRMVVCRAHRGNGVIDLFPLRVARRGNGQYTIEVPASNVPRGRYDEASFEVGRDAEPVKATADGAYLFIPVDEDMLGRVARARGFRWAVNHRLQTGSVTFDASLGTVVNRLRQCVRNNGGR